MKNKKIEILIVAIFLIIQTIIYICVGANKSYIHIDEAYSFGLTNYERIEIQDNEDFFNNWHKKEYYEDYLSIQEDEVGKYTPVYENQKNDVHPPLYYFLLRIAMGFTKGYFSKWSGIVLNIIIYIFITIFMYLIMKKLFKDDKNSKEKSIILSFISSIILASVSNVIYIRMYALSTLIVLITTYLHIKLLESKKINIKLLIYIGISVLAGILTHYYYLFYLISLYLIFFIKYIKKRKRKELIYYTLTMITSGIVSLIVFPYSIQHMFFGYRGQGVISNLKNIHEIIPSIFSQIYNLNYYGFNNLMFVIIAIIIGILIYNKIYIKGTLKISKDKEDILKIIYIPSLFFFIISTIASPWRVLRYFVPVCGLIFIILIYYLYKLIQTIFCEKASNIFMCILFSVILVSPFILKMEPELLYSDRKEFIQKLNSDLNVPTIYFYNSQKSVFLDDILSFSIVEESYISKDIDYTKENIQKILENKDISKGIVIFINEDPNNDATVNMIKKYLNLTYCEHIKKLTSCDVYYLNN